MSGPDLLRRQAAEVGVHLEGEQASLVLRFEGLLIDHAMRAGMIAASDRPRIRERHVLDCLRAVATLDGCKDCYDLGAGAGLPGIILAIATPSLGVRLVESRARRVSFLELALETLDLGNAQVLASRIEDLQEPLDACVARAYAPLPRTWAAARTLLRPGGRLVYFAGKPVDPTEVPPDAVLEGTLENPVLESSGPLVIMTRQ